jgi:hypothetical protein
MEQTFKSGELALIVGSAVEENIGVTVRLVEFFPVGAEPVILGRRYTPREHKSWLVESVDGAQSLLVRIEPYGLIDCRRAGVCRQSWLMPLRGDFNPEQQKAKEAEPCA